MAYPVSDLYRRAVRNGAQITYTVDASIGGAPVAGATGLRPVGGNITDTTKPGVRRVLNLDLAPSPGLFDKLSPIGTTLTVTAHVRFTDRTVEDIPMGVFDVDSEKLSEGGGGLSLTAPDKWARIQRARFLQPVASSTGAPVATQLVSLIQGALGNSEPVVLAVPQIAATVPTMTWDRDRDKAIIDLAAGVGWWVYFDRYGVATVAPIPTIGKSADWLVDASAAGVLTELDRTRSRQGTSNVVAVSSSSASASFDTQFAWDSDVNSPTYAGPNPVTNPGGAGPFRVVPYFFETPLLLDNVGALATARTILARTTGLASQVSLGQVPNPAVDAFDVLDVLPPRERYDIARVLERHVADDVTHPLAVGTAQSISGRSTRTDEFV